NPLHLNSLSISFFPPLPEVGLVPLSLPLAHSLSLTHTLTHTHTHTLTHKHTHTHTHTHQLTHKHTHALSHSVGTLPVCIMGSHQTHHLMIKANDACPC